MRYWRIYNSVRPPLQIMEESKDIEGPSVEAGDPDGKSSCVVVVQSWSVDAQSGSGRVHKLG